MGVASFGKSKFTTDHEQCEWVGYRQKKDSTGEIYPSRFLITDDTDYVIAEVLKESYNTVPHSTAPW
ncbi:unnamed protein product [Rhizophagus irregularis]|nr:unnamed protein product [Rhizophagus irregularis]